jgi:hypothetical protein
MFLVEFMELLVLVALVLLSAVVAVDLLCL